MAAKNILQKIIELEATAAMLQKDCRELRSLLAAEVSTSAPKQKSKAASAVAARKSFIHKKRLAV